MKQLLFAITLFLMLAMTPLQAGKVDVNKADAQALQENLEGVGEIKAKAIVNYRRKHGKFKSLDDLMQVPGIGEATINKNRRNLSLKGGASKSSKKQAKDKTESTGNKTKNASSKKKSTTSKSKTSKTKNSTKTAKKTASKSKKTSEK